MMYSHGRLCHVCDDAEIEMYDPATDQYTYLQTTPGRRPVDIPGVTVPAIIPYDKLDCNSTTLSGTDQRGWQQSFTTAYSTGGAIVKAKVDSACTELITSNPAFPALDGWSDCAIVVYARGAKGEMTRLEKQGPVTAYSMTLSATLSVNKGSSK